MAVPMVMKRRRAAWCPRCDELRTARAGTRCPACGSTLLPVPTGERPAGGGWRAAAGAERLRALFPAIRTLGTGLVVVAVVAGAFAAGRATQATPAAVQAAPSTTEPDTGQPDQGLATRGDSFYNWPSRQRAGLTLTTVPGGIGDLAAVAAMTVQGVTVASRLDELAKGTLVDPHLSASDVRPPPATCGGCRLDVRCTRCRTMRVVAFAYRHADVVVVLAPKGPRPASVLGGGSPQVLVSDDLTSSDVQPAVSAAPDGTTAVRFEARALDVGGGARRAHGFSIDVQDNLAREVQGPWQMSTQP